MKHPHSEKITAKAENLNLIVFCKGKYVKEWSILDSPDGGTSFPFDYHIFLCHPKHQDVCFEWLNGVVAEYLLYDGMGHEDDVWCDIDGMDRFSWYQECPFMDGSIYIRIKTEKQKKWLVIKKDDLVTSCPRVDRKDALKVAMAHENFKLSEKEVLNKWDLLEIKVVRPCKDSDTSYTETVQP